ncbi:MAG: hypothetical protein BWX73_01326 [Lentisphaerae bacterium ADurb.Bin082]|nr:MAG: hypothetical protein BWX73_01326 [Lentisphaerae bacterium ADurb.Bin082]
MPTPTPVSRSDAAMTPKRCNNLYDELRQAASAYFCMPLEECGPIAAELLLCLEAALAILEKKHLEPSGSDFLESLGNILLLSSRLRGLMLAEVANDLQDSLGMDDAGRLAIINDCMSVVQTAKTFVA